MPNSTIFSTILTLDKFLKYDAYKNMFDKALTYNVDLGIYLNNLYNEILRSKFEFTPKGLEYKEFTHPEAFSEAQYYWRWALIEGTMLKSSDVSWDVFVPQVTAFSKDYKVFVTRYVPNLGLLAESYQFWKKLN